MLDVREMLLYTWKDVERCLLLNKDRWNSGITSIEIYFSEVIVYLSSMDLLNAVQNNLVNILARYYNSQEQKIYLELKDQYLTVHFEVSEEDRNDTQVIPLFNKILYEESAYYEAMVNQNLAGSPVIAFHSYKGGVGRTLSLLAFVKAWSSAINDKKGQGLLIIDSDIEAPGITWLTGGANNSTFSYLDLLEVIQGQESVDEIVELIAEKVGELTIKVETNKEIVEHIILPTYRYEAQLLDIYSSPESIVNSYNKKFILAEVLSKLGKKLDVAAVLVDLRAGLSEFSAPLLFDPRVKKYIVTSTSYQSVKGTELLLNQLSKGLPISENTILPEIFLTMVPNDVNTADILSGLIAIYDKNTIDKESSLTDNLVTELPFASELIHLESLSQIMKNLEGREFYKNILSLIQNNYSFEEREIENIVVNRREEVIGKVYSLAKEQINAEGNVAFNVLLTEPINNLVKRFKTNIPNTVIMGAKGSGKTFLYREILRNKYWESFLAKMERESRNSDCTTIVVPLLAAKNAIGFKEILQNAILNFNEVFVNEKMSNSVWLDNENEIKAYCRENHDTLDWSEFWKKLILKSIGSLFGSLDELEKVLEIYKKRIIFLVDGLEEIFTKTLFSTTEKNAIIALCQEVLNELKIKYKNIGSIIFLRKDLARDSIEVNFEQFNTLYNSVELKWSRTEALRLVVWLISQAVPDFYQENVKVEIASQEVIEKNLTKLWGVKLGKADSNEAYSSRWILAALSDFNGQLQARDIIRFLQYATEEVGKSTYEDRYIMPTEIKKAVPKCSSDKISEVTDEIGALKPIFDKLIKAPAENKILPFSADTFDLSAIEERLMKQEGYLKVDNDKYYLPEIIRHALKFKYERGARPKVLSLLLNK